MPFLSANIVGIGWLPEAASVTDVNMTNASTSQKVDYF